MPNINWKQYVKSNNITEIVAKDVINEDLIIFEAKDNEGCYNCYFVLNSEYIIHINSSCYSEETKNGIIKIINNSMNSNMVLKREGYLAYLCKWEDAIEKLHITDISHTELDMGSIKVYKAKNKDNEPYLYFVLNGYYITSLYDMDDWPTYNKLISSMQSVIEICLGSK